MSSFRWFVPWGGVSDELTLETLINLYLAGCLSPDDLLICPWGLSKASDLISRSSDTDDRGWSINRFERAAASAEWSLVFDSQRIGRFSLDELRNLAFELAVGPDSVVVQRSEQANPIPLQRLLSLPEPKEKQQAWGKVAAWAAVIAGGGVLLKWALEDPEPRAIRKLAREKSENGAFLVFADIKGYARPPILNGRIADVVAYYRDGAIEVIEVENERSIERAHARGQIRDLAIWASRSRYRSLVVEIVDGGRGGKG